MEKSANETSRSRSIISVKDGEDVKKGGKMEFRDMISGITVTNETDKETGKKGMVVTEHKEDLHPQVVIIRQMLRKVNIIR